MSRIAGKMAPSGRRSANRRTTARLIAVAAAACVALAGCSSSEPDTTVSYDVTVAPADAGSGSLPDPCSLLTPASISAASGIDFADGYFNDDLSTDTQSICEWLPTGATFPLVQVIVSGGSAQVSTERATAESMFGTAVDVTVPGAQDAYSVAKGSLIGMAVGDYFLQVGYMSTDSTDVRAIALTLAANAAAALS